MLRYAITGGNDGGSWEANISQARLWAFEGLDYVQLREKHLDAGELVQMARAMVEVFREADTRTKLLVNGRADVAVAAGADGVHLTSRPGELTAVQVRRVFSAAGRPEPVVSASCHALEEVLRAVAGGVDLVLFGPVFEKRDAGRKVVAGVGFEALQKACVAAAGTPVLALGGVTRADTALCMEAGAAGVAGIRLFL